MCGDWNFALDPDLDYNNNLHINNPKARKVILDYIVEENLLVVWRVSNENSRKYTWRRLNPVIKQARLDFHLISENMFQFVTDAKIIPGYRTDHSGIALKLKLIDRERGRGYGKFNNTLLKDKDYVSLIKNTRTIDDVKKTYVSNENNLNHGNISNEEIQFNINDQLFFRNFINDDKRQYHQIQFRKEEKKIMRKKH